MVAHLLPYTFEIEYRKGTNHQNADALSQMNNIQENSHLACALSFMEPEFDNWPDNPWTYYLDGFEPIF
jgi:hypothetical protein